MSSPLGAVLAGGSSSRFGAPKALALLRGRTLLERALGSVAAAGLEPVVLAREGSPLPPAVAARVLRDPPGDPHPLRAIGAVLEAGRPAVVLACDMPLVPPALLAWLAELDERLAVTELGGRVQPLLGRYEPAVARELGEAADRGEAARDAVLSLGARRIGEGEVGRFGDPESIALNVNRPEDLARAEHLLPRPGGLSR